MESRTSRSQSKACHQYGILQTKTSFVLIDIDLDLTLLSLPLQSTTTTFTMGERQGEIISITEGPELGETGRPQVPAKRLNGDYPVCDSSTTTTTHTYLHH